MKHIITALALLASFCTLFSQGNLGIGTMTPHSSAKVHIESIDKGLLIPRMTSAQRGAITSPATGLLVYDMSTSSVWHYDGASWKEIVAGVGGANDEIIDADNDTRVRVEANPNEDMIRFDMGGTEHFRMVDGRLEVLNTGESIFIGEGAGANDDLTNTNVFIGHLSGNQNTLGFWNIGLGAQTLEMSFASNNVAIGHSSMALSTLGHSNCAIGTNSLLNNQTSHNVALGFHALSTNHGFTNVAIGSDALRNNYGDDNIAIGPATISSTANHQGIRNTVVGRSGMENNSTGDYNTAMGYRVLNENRAGDRIVAIGAFAMQNANNTQTAFFSENVAIGYEALRGSNSPATNTGVSNTAIGSQAMRVTTSGSHNTAVGFGTLATNSTGSNNIAGGYESAYSNTTGNQNSAYGYQALRANTGGNNNVAVGYHALHSATASNNTAIGHSALRLTSSGAQNTAIGGFALEDNVSGTQNVAVGYNALANSTGSYNTASGVEALFNNAGGLRNTAMGHSALKSNTSGENNTAVGIFALENSTTGGNNTAIGYSAHSNAGNFTNSAGIGYDADPTATNHIRIGNGSVAWIGGQVSWSAISDGRFKTDIHEDVPGLDFITKLRPVTYHMDLDAMADWKEMHTGERDNSDYPEKYNIESQLFSGFIAQEVEAAAYATGYDFSGVCTPANETDVYALRYAEFVVPLVKAVQELVDQNGRQQQTIDDLISRISFLEQENSRLTSTGATINTHR